MEPYDKRPVPHGTGACGWVQPLAAGFRVGRLRRPVTLRLSGMKEGSSGENVLGRER